MSSDADRPEHLEIDATALGGKSWKNAVHRARLASTQWLEYVEMNLRTLVDQFAEADTAFSFTEIFTDAPPGTVGWEDGVSAYHYRISGRDVDIRPGRIGDADLTVIVDYRNALLEVSKVYTPTLRRLRAEGAQPPSPIKLIGDMKRKPEWISEIHNMMVPMTTFEA
jgi:hypothetical protein